MIYICPICGVVDEAFHGCWRSARPTSRLRYRLAMISEYIAKRPGWAMRASANTARRKAGRR
jgi:hypothetical protein